MFGITNIKVEFFTCTKSHVDELNNFLKKHDGNIIDIQYQQNDLATKQIMVVYQDVN